MNDEAIVDALEEFKNNPPVEPNCLCNCFDNGFGEGWDAAIKWVKNVGENKLLDVMYPKEGEESESK